MEAIYFSGSGNIIVYIITTYAQYRMSYHHHHCHEHNQGLDLKTCSVKAQGVLGFSFFI
jgi:hypothetical protein